MLGQYGTCLDSIRYAWTEQHMFGQHRIYLNITGFVWKYNRIRLPMGSIGDVGQLSRTIYS